MTILYKAGDADRSILNGQRIALFGYTELGRALALNLRDSGVEVVIGAIEGQPIEPAQNDGFVVLPSPEAAMLAAIKWITVPDESLTAFYMNNISPGLKTGEVLLFSTGYPVGFGLVEAPPFVDVCLIAPRHAATQVRQGYLDGNESPSFVAVYQDYSAAAWDRLLAVASAAGTLRSGALEISFRQEAELGIFNQQVILPILHNAIMTAAEVLISEGFPPEAVISELFASGMLGQLLEESARSGLSESLRLLPKVGQYNILTRAELWSDLKARRTMEAILQDIRSGKFGREWSNEVVNDLPRLAALQRKRASMNYTAHERTAFEGLERGENLDQDQHEPIISDPDSTLT